MREGLPRAEEALEHLKAIAAANPTSVWHVGTSAIRTSLGEERRLVIVLENPLTGPAAPGSVGLTGG